MATDRKVARRIRSILELATEIGNVSKASKRPRTWPIAIKSVHQQDLQAMHRIRDRLVISALA